MLSANTPACETPRPLRPILRALALCCFCAQAHLEWDWLYAAWAVVGAFASFDLPIPRSARA